MWLSRFSLRLHRVILLSMVAVFALGTWAQGQMVSIPALGLRVARGFRVVVVATGNEVPSVQAMTLDSAGRIIATGPGYIRTLLDLNGDGRPETVREYGPTETGGTGMCCIGPELYYAGDGGLWRYRDQDGQGVADGPPEQIGALASGEFGIHHVRQGPDGWLYVMAGPESQVTNLNLSTTGLRPNSSGSLLRVLPSGGGWEIVANGFRNARAIDFDPAGDIFTADMDGEPDQHLPWYVPARVIQVAPGADHGWNERCGRPDHYPDAVSAVTGVGRGMISAVSMYEHYQFPPYYRGGCFAADQDLGRIYFLPLEPGPSTHVAQAEVFMESLHPAAFHPSDVLVTPQGSLLVANQVWGNAPAIYRVDFIPAGDLTPIATNWWATALTEVESVFTIPQPRDPWSRALWMPLAQIIGRGPFERTLMDTRVPPPAGLRAVDVLTALFQGLGPAAAPAAAAGSAEVRGAAAWSLGRAPGGNGLRILVGLCHDTDPYVRRCALEGMLNQTEDVPAELLMDCVTENLGSPDKRVRQAAARLGAAMDESSWAEVWAGLPQAPIQARLTGAMVQTWRGAATRLNVPAIDLAMKTLPLSRSPDYRLQALRVMVLGLGGYKVKDPLVESQACYQPAATLAGEDALVEKLGKAVGAIFPSGDPVVDFEAARILAMVESADAALPAKVAALCTGQGLATTDFHYLIVLTRLKGLVPPAVFARLAKVILTLDRGWTAEQQSPTAYWHSRAAEVVRILCEKNPALGAAILGSPGFAAPNHLYLAPWLGSQYKAATARAFLSAVRSRPSFPWSVELVEVLGVLPAAEVHPILRQHWSDPRLRDAIVKQLANQPEEADRELLLAGMESRRPEILHAAMGALRRLPQESSARVLVAALRQLRRLLVQPWEQKTRGQLVEMINDLTGQSFKAQESGADLASLRRTYQPVFSWVAQRRPELVRALESSAADDPENWKGLLSRVPWARGDIARGGRLFANLGCESCHTGRNPLGPALGGVTLKTAPVDLLMRINFPSLQPSRTGRVTHVVMRDGRSYAGMVSSETSAGLVIRTDPVSSVFVRHSDIDSREQTDMPFMPANLLGNLEPQALADLHAYLKALPPPR